MSLMNVSNGRRGSLLAWDPLRLFDDLLRWEPAGSEAVWSPYVSPVSVKADDDVVTVTAEMPGVGPDDLELTFQAGDLAISGKRGERQYAFRVRVGEMVDPDNIEADLEHGVLTVRAHKRPEAKPRKIALKSANGQKALGTGDKS